MTTGTLDDDRRGTLAVVADLLIPASATALSASAADVQGSGIDRVLVVRPDLLAPVVGLIDEVTSALPATFEDLYSLRSPSFGGFAEAVTAAYYLNPVVANSVGYAKRSAIPIVFDDDLDSLVRHVAARGPIYRPTPSADSERNR